MEPVSVISLITVALPFLTAAIKKLLHTEKWAERPRKGFHSLVPVILGILSAGLYEYSRSGDGITALAVGLGSGGAASSVRDIDKNITQVVSAVLSLLKKRQTTDPT